MFSTEHLIWLGISFLIITAITLLAVFIAKKEWQKYLILRLAGFILLITETAKAFYYIEKNPDGATGFYMKVDALPFQLGSILTVALNVIAWTKNVKLKDRLLAFFYPCAVAGGIFSLLLADFTIPEVMRYRYFITYSIITGAGVFVAVTKPKNFKFGDSLRWLKIFAPVVSVVFYINAVLKTNFLYLSQPIAGFPVVLDNYYGYLAELIIIAAVSVTLLYLPFIFTETKRQIIWRRTEK